MSCTVCPCVISDSRSARPRASCSRYWRCKSAWVISATVLLHGAGDIFATRRIGSVRIECVAQPASFVPMPGKIVRRRQAAGAHKFPVPGARVDWGAVCSAQIRVMPVPPKDAGVSAHAWWSSANRHFHQLQAALDKPSPHLVPKLLQEQAEDRNGEHERQQPDAADRSDEHANQSEDRGNEK